MRVQLIVGARPNFVQITQCPRVLRERGIELQLVHTGQHSDHAMSRVFLDQFGLEPDVLLATPGGGAIERMARMLVDLEAAMTRFEPDWVLVPGDVDSTLAGALVANRLRIPLGHIESGLRSFDRSMPEENNRVVTDALADLCFVTEPSGVENLRREGKAEATIHFVGNTMIDTLVAFQPQIEASDIIRRLGIGAGRFGLVTMHRPVNVDSAAGLERLRTLLASIGQQMTIIFPMHPRTRERASASGLLDALERVSGLRIIPPLDYFAMQRLVRDAAVVLTDSGGLQEECTFTATPCITLRDSTERPITVSEGSNTLMPFDCEAVASRVATLAAAPREARTPPQRWDGRATERIVDVLCGA